MLINTVLLLTTPTSVAPPPPEGLEVILVAHSSVVVAWQPYSGPVPGIIVNYTVQYVPLFQEEVNSISLSVPPSR